MIKKLLSVVIIISMIMSLFAEFPVIDQDEIFIPVSIVGAVEYPGIYKVPAGSRLSEALMFYEELALEKQATEDLDFFEEEEQEDIEYSLRRIYHIREDQEEIIDHQKFLVLGDQSANPLLKGGDVIRLVSASYGIEIFGEVNSPGEYEYCEGDCVNDIIELALGLKVSARVDTAEIVRTDKLTGEIEVIGFSPIEAFLGQSIEGNPLLTIGDRIYIRRQVNFDTEYNVEVAGMVKYPGEYAILEGKTRLSDVLKKSGGALQEGSLAKAYIQRISKRDTMISHDPELKRLMLLDELEMSQVEYEYQKFKLRELEGKLNVDFTAVWAGDENAYDPLLEDGDYIYIPREVTTVQVSGAVMNPGAYPYVSGKTYEYYVEAAGGYTNNAFKRRMRIIKDDTGSWLKRDKEHIISNGDLIFVPEKEELDYMEMTRNVFTILAQLATVILAVDNMNSN